LNLNLFTPRFGLALALSTPALNNKVLHDRECRADDDADETPRRRAELDEG
jgi:hypothetical protein